MPRGTRAQIYPELSTHLPANQTGGDADSNRHQAGDGGCELLMSSLRRIVQQCRGPLSPGRNEPKSSFRIWREAISEVLLCNCLCHEHPSLSMSLSTVLGPSMFLWTLIGLYWNVPHLPGSPCSWIIPAEVLTSPHTRQMIRHYGM